MEQRVQHDNDNIPDAEGEAKNIQTNDKKSAKDFKEVEKQSKQEHIEHLYTKKALHDFESDGYD